MTVSDEMKNQSLRIIRTVFRLPQDESVLLVRMKSGMTNDSFCFSVSNRKYIIRIPGPGTSSLINRHNEAAVYKALAGFDISDDVIYMDPVTGIKISVFLDNTHVCDPESDSDLNLCMEKLRAFHNAGIHVEHSFDLFDHIEQYESLMRYSNYPDYDQTKRNVYGLDSFISKQPRQRTLTHIDSIADNFLIANTEKADVHLIDWEYAGMQDPHVDIAMFCIYSGLSFEHINHVIDVYFRNGCTDDIRLKIYCYIAISGLLWSNWCEFKERSGIEFGSYALNQYRYAKEYAALANKLIGMHS